MALELGAEGLDRLGAGSLIGRVGGVVGDEVDLEHAGVQRLGQLAGLGVGVVDAGEHHVLHEHHPPLALVVSAAGGQHVAQRVAVVDRHQLRAQRLVGGVQRQGQADRHRLGRQPLDPGDPADRRHRGVAVADAHRRQPLARRQHGVEVHHRLAHPHEHGVVDLAAATEVQRLVEDLRRRQVAPEAHRPGGAEGARERAARLRGQAQGPPPVAIAHEHGLHRAPIGGLKQRLDGAVGGAGLLHEREARVRDGLVQRGAQ